MGCKAVYGSAPRRTAGRGSRNGPREAPADGCKGGRRPVLQLTDDLIRAQRETVQRIRGRRRVSRVFRSSYYRYLAYGGREERARHLVSQS